MWQVDDYHYVPEARQLCRGTNYEQGGESTRTERSKGGLSKTV